MDILLNHTKESRRSLVMVLGLCLAMGWQAVSADDLVYTFKGVLPTGSTAHTSVSDGETFSAIFTIDPSTGDSNPSAATGSYTDAVLSGVLVFSGGYVSPLSFTDYNVLVFDDAGTDTVDGVSVREGAIIIQASTRDLTTLASDALPLDGTEFQSAPDPDTVPFFQLEYADAGGTINYNATTANNVSFLAKDGIAWSNATGSPNPWYDVSGNWLTGLDIGPPSDTDAALFNLARNYDVWWDSVTGDRTARELCVTNGNVTFDNQDGGTYTLTVEIDTVVEGPAVLNIGDGTDTVNLDTGGFLIVDGDFNIAAGTAVTAAQARIDGPGATMQIGTGATVNVDGSIEAGFLGEPGSFREIRVDDALLTSGDTIIIGGAFLTFTTLYLEDDGDVSAANEIVVAPFGTVETLGTTGIPELFANAIVNAGQLILEHDIGTDINASVMNTGTIHSVNISKTSFLGPVIHDFFGEIRTDLDAASVFFDAASGAGSYTGAGEVTFTDNFNPGGGSGIGTTAAISFGGDVLLAPAASLNIDLGLPINPANFDRLLISGDLTIVAGGSLSVNTIGGFVPCNNQEFLIIEVDGTRTGTFFGLPEGAVVASFGATNLLISYVAGDGNDIALIGDGPLLRGDVNLDCEINFLDIQPFRDLLLGGGYQVEADMNEDGVVDFLDIQPFVDLLK